MSTLKDLRGSAAIVGAATFGCGECPGHTDLEMLAKAAHAAAGTRAAVCQVDGARWITFEGAVTVSDDPALVAEAVAAYAERYRPPKERADRVVLRIVVDRVLSSARLQA